MRIGRLVSLGTVRRWLQPVVLKWIGRDLDRTVEIELDGFAMRIPPTVFHPKYFGTSRILGRYIASLDLHGKTVLDMGAGSGLIALQASRAGATVTAVDVNPAAVESAMNNAQANNLSILAICSDLFEALPARRFDVIAWNPPFFKQEPRTMADRAFSAGANLETIRRFASELRNHLSDRGVAYLIFSADADMATIKAIFLDSGFAIKSVHNERWGLGELMMIVEIRGHTDRKCR